MNRPPLILLRRLLHASPRITHSNPRPEIKRELQMPNLSDSKWKRRSKLSAMNFANKNKTGHRQRLSATEPTNGPPPSKRERELARMQRPKEQLPKSKANQTPQELTADEMREVYAAMKQINITKEEASRIKLPGKIDPQQVTFLDSRRIELVEAAAAERIRQRLLSSGLPDDLLPTTKDSISSDTPTAASVDQQSNVVAICDDENSSSTDIITEPTVDHEFLSQIIYLNAKTARPQQAEQALQLILENGLQPTVDDYNRVMDAYVNAKDLPGALQTFQRIRNDAAIEANVKSFGIIIKCLAQERRVVDAFKLYEQMKQLQLVPTQPIYTTLIKACSQAGDYNRAWRLFEHMRNEVCRPDEITMNHMIHICAKTNNVEKALVLFSDFHRKPSPSGTPLIPLESTFNSLIHACARRPDYYAQTFDLVQQMQDAGFQPDRLTYNYMLLACRTQGDVWRAKALWTEMISRATESGDMELMPDEQSYTQMLQCYSRVPALLQTVWRKTVWDAKMREFTRQQQMAKMGLENEERAKQGLRPIDINEWLRDENYDPDAPLPPPMPNQQLEELRQYVLEGKSEAERLLELKQEALSFFDGVVCAKLLPPQTEPSTQERPLKMTVQLLNAQLQTLGAFRCRPEMLAVYRERYAQLNLQPNGQTYLSFLRHWFDNPQKYDQNQQTDTNEKMMTGETLLAHGWNVYEDYERYRRLQGLPERWEELEVKYLRNKWQQLGITHDHRRIEYDIYRYTIAGLAKHNDLVRATRLLGILLERGHARVTNMMHLRPDHYSPTRHSSTDHGVQADQLRFSQFPVHPAVIEASPEVDRSLFDKSDGSSTEINNINNSTLLLQKYTSPHVRHSGVDDSQLNPSYAQPSVQFRPRDFQLLLNRVRDAGDKSLLSRVESLLDMARRTSGRQERLASSQMQQVKDRLRKRWY